MSEKKIPSPEEIQKEFEDFVRNRFGGSVQVFTQNYGAEPHQHETPNETAEPDKPDIFNFNMKPREVKAYLDRFVIKQEEAKKALSIAVCDHYNQIARQRRHPEQDFEYAKQNVLLLGPTGVGKTYLIKQIAKLIGVPFVKADATRFSETGYVGSNVDDLIKDLVSQAGGDIEAAQYGIIYLDEADKLASAPGHGGRDVSGRGVQFGMLKLMEETEVDLSAGNDPRSQMQALMEMQRKGRIDRKVVNTRNILFIVSGAFSGLDDIIKRRLEHNAIGFGSGFNREQQRGEIFNYAATQDFVEYGFEPEFIGRLPIRVACHHLDRNDLFDVLKNSEGSILRQYIDAFGDYGINLSFEDEALAQISALAEREKTGARALVTICENILREYKFELPSSAVKDLTVTPDLVSDPTGVLDGILADPHQHSSEHQQEVDDYFERFRLNHRITLNLTPEGVRAVAAEAARRKVVIGEILDELLGGYEHGLALIRQTTGQDNFTLGPSLVDHPKRTLERMVTECFQARPPLRNHGPDDLVTH